MNRDRAVFLVVLAAFVLVAIYGHWLYLMLLVVALGGMFMYEFVASLVTIRRRRRRTDAPGD